MSSVDELMTLLYPESWKMFKCELRHGGQSDSRREDSVKFAAAHYNYNADIWKSKCDKGYFAKCNSELILCHYNVR